MQLDRQRLARRARTRARRPDARPTRSRRRRPARMRTTASVTSGPMPSPGISVIVCVIYGSSATSKTRVSRISLSRVPEQQHETERRIHRHQGGRYLVQPIEFDAPCIGRRQCAHRPETPAHGRAVARVAGSLNTPRRSASPRRSPRAGMNDVRRRAKELDREEAHQHQRAADVCDDMKLAEHRADSDPAIVEPFAGAAL